MRLSAGLFLCITGCTRCVIESSFTLALEIPFRMLGSTVMRYSSILEPLFKIDHPVSVMPMSSSYRWYNYMLLSSPLGYLGSSVHLYHNSLAGECTSHSSVHTYEWIIIVIVLWLKCSAVGYMLLLLPRLRLPVFVVGWTDVRSIGQTVCTTCCCCRCRNKKQDREK